MTTFNKQRVLVIYGGPSGEHEVSLMSAASIIQNLDPERFDVIPAGINHQGQWFLNDLSLIEKKSKALALLKNAPEILLSPHPHSISKGLCLSTASPHYPEKMTPPIDVVFPVIHGSFGEDGILQGLLETLHLPYVGCGVLASAIGMDKEVSKRLIRDAGLPIVPYLVLTKGEWEQQLSMPHPCAHYSKKIQTHLGDYPIFIKPNQMGSSVGIQKVSTEQQLFGAFQEAFQYDTKLLMEKAIDAREIEFSVLENSHSTEPPWVSAPGEIEPTHEFYSYDAKYTDTNGAHLSIPATLSAEQSTFGKQFAQTVFNVLNCEGMARVDLFLDKQTGHFYFNEINTIPGFTSISMYPKLWEYSGISYRDLLSRLIDLALARHQRKKTLQREYHLIKN